MLCPEGSVKLVDEGKCIYCDTGCKECQTDGACIECYPEYVNFEAICYKECPDGTYNNSGACNYC